MVNMFERKSHHYNTGSSSLNYTLPKIKCAVGKVFHYDDTSDWNSIPRDIQEVLNDITFKKKLKRYLW